MHHPIHATWTEGPLEKPNRRVTVEIIRPSDTAEFFIVCDPESGECYKAHRDNLRLLWAMPPIDGRDQE